VTILTSEGALVRTQLCPPKSPGQDTASALFARHARSSDRRLTVAANVESWHQAAQIVTDWHAGRVRRSRPLNRLGVQPMVDPRASVVHPSLRQRGCRTDLEGTCLTDHLESELERAYALGRANLVTMELARRYCLHMPCSERGGRGMAEQTSGLPIASRRCGGTCWPPPNTPARC